MGRRWFEIRHKKTEKMVYSTNDETEAKHRLHDCWPKDEYELVTVREIKELK